jgi:hypothetical protein
MCCARCLAESGCRLPGVAKPAPAGESMQRHARHRVARKRRSDTRRTVMPDCRSRRTASSHRIVAPPFPRGRAGIPGPGRFSPGRERRGRVQARSSAFGLFSTCRTVSAALRERRVCLYFRSPVRDPGSCLFGSSEPHAILYACSSIAKALGKIFSRAAEPAKRPAWAFRADCRLWAGGEGTGIMQQRPHVRLVGPCRYRSRNRPATPWLS